MSCNLALGESDTGTEIPMSGVRRGTRGRPVHDNLTQSQDPVSFAHFRIKLRAHHPVTRPAHPTLGPMGSIRHASAPGHDQLLHSLIKATLELARSLTVVILCPTSMTMESATSATPCN